MANLKIVILLVAFVVLAVTAAPAEEPAKDLKTDESVGLGYYRSSPFIGAYPYNTWGSNYGYNNYYGGGYPYYRSNFGGLYGNYWL